MTDPLQLHPQLFIEAPLRGRHYATSIVGKPFAPTKCSLTVVHPYAMPEPTLTVRLTGHDAEGRPTSNVPARDLADLPEWLRNELPPWVLPMVAAALGRPVMVIADPDLVNAAQASIGRQVDAMVEARLRDWEDGTDA